MTRIIHWQRNSLYIFRCVKEANEIKHVEDIVGFPFCFLFFWNCSILKKIRKTHSPILPFLKFNFFQQKLYLSLKNVLLLREKKYINISTLHPNKKSPSLKAAEFWMTHCENANLMKNKISALWNGSEWSDKYPYAKKQKFEGRKRVNGLYSSISLISGKGNHWDGMEEKNCAGNTFRLAHPVAPIVD